MSAPLLILDDDPAQIMALEEFLRDAGHTNIVSFNRAAPALAFVTKTLPALALLDVRLAAGETSEEIALHLLSVGAPFVFLTGLVNLDSLNNRLAGTHFVEKPFSTDTILTLLADHGIHAGG